MTYKNSWSNQVHNHVIYQLRLTVSPHKPFHQGSRVSQSCQRNSWTAHVYLSEIPDPTAGRGQSTNIITLVFRQSRKRDRDGIICPSLIPKPREGLETRPMPLVTEGIHYQGSLCDLPRRCLCVPWRYAGGHLSPRPRRGWPYHSHRLPRYETWWRESIMDLQL